MHQTLTERWNRISLRTKITGVTVLMLTVGLLVSGIGTAAMLRSYVDDQMASKLTALARGNVGQFFDFDTASGIDLGGDGVRPSDDVFVALYDETTGHFESHNWIGRDSTTWPQVPETLTQGEVNRLNLTGFRTFSLDDTNGNGTFRAVTTLMTIDSHGTLAPVLIALSTQETEQLIAVYLTIFLGFGVGVVLIGALLTRMLVTSTFAPLREVERTAAEIADGDFSQRLGGATPNTEVGRLNRSLNTMLNRIDRAFRDRARTIDQMRRFVGDASHELRTPLVSVRGYAELYRMGALQSPEEVAQAMDRIEKEAKRMGGLVEDLLALARLDEAKPLELANVDLVPLAHDAALDAKAAHPERPVTVVALVEPASTAATTDDDDDSATPAVEPPTATGPFSFAGATLARLRGRRKHDRVGDDTVPIPLDDNSDELDEAPPHAPMLRSEPTGTRASGAVVSAEENKIRQVITNLMGNAMRFTEPTSPLEIRVSVDESSERAMIEIVDHGEGIPPQIREKIFQRFWRADTSRARETGGSGLGLAIVSSIVAAHNGTVDAVETPGGGATFRVQLPLAGSAAAPRSVDVEN